MPILTDDAVRALQSIEAASKEIRPMPSHLRTEHVEEEEVAVQVEAPVTTASDNVAKELYSAMSCDEYFKVLSAAEVLGMTTRRVDTNSDRVHKWIEKIDVWLNEANAVTSDINTLHKKLSSLVEINSAVKQQSTFLSSKASSLITTSENCQKLCNGIEDRLKHFATVDRLSNELSTTIDPKSKRFKQLLQDMDATMQFLSANSDYKSSAQYLSRMHVTQQKALVLLRDTIISSIQAQTESIAKDSRFSTILQRTQTKGWGSVLTRNTSTESVDTKGDTAVSSEGHSPTTDELNTSRTLPPGSFGLGSVLSIEFRARLHETVPLIASLTQRCTADTAATANYVFYQDVADAYVAARLSLLTPIFTDYMAPHMGKTVDSRDLVGMVAHGTTYLLAMATDEAELFQYLWKDGEMDTKDSKTPQHLAVAKQIVDSVALSLYDSFRSTVLLEDNLKTLCTIIHTLNNSVLARLQAAGEAGMLLSGTLSHMCQDAQERLIFRASMYIKDSVTPFNANQAECLKYTEGSGAFSFEKNQKTAAPAAEEEGGLIAPVETQAEYFPTLTNTLTLLASLYNVVDKGVFSVLAQEAIKACTYNLMQVATEIKGVPRTTLPTAELDSRLFLVKHLLQLREQISPFEVNFEVVEKHIDMTNLRLNEISIATTQHDIKKDLEKQLKQVCEQFISIASHYVGAAIVRFAKLLKDRTKDPLAATESLGSLLENVLTNMAKTPTEPTLPAGEAGGGAAAAGGGAGASAAENAGAEEGAEGAAPVAVAGDADGKTQQQASEKLAQVCFGG